MLTNHRRALAVSMVLLAALVFMLIAVGRHPAIDAPETTFPFVGHFDHTVNTWMDDIRNVPLSGVFRFLNVLGAGLITIPLRIVVSLYLLVRRRFLAFWAFVLAWAASELALTWLKTFFHRGRPLAPLVDISGFSFPSGHAVAGAALAVALVLVAFPPGPRRRKWEIIAIGFAFVMAFSRVYLSAHWFSDVVAGVLLGAGIALGSAALVIEIDAMLVRRHVVHAPPRPPGDPLDPALP
jgi:membrane-associated phospholipid phosphatase